MDEFDFGMVSAVASRQAAKLVLLTCEQEKDGNKMAARIKLEKEMQDIEKSVRFRRIDGEQDRESCTVFDLRTSDSSFFTFFRLPRVCSLDIAYSEHDLVFLSRADDHG